MNILKLILFLDIYEHLQCTIIKSIQYVFTFVGRV